MKTALIVIGCLILAAAALSGGHISKADVIDILDSCDAMADLPESSFVRHSPSETSPPDIKQAAVASMGEYYGQHIAEKGVKIEWPSTGAARKQSWLAACRRFEASLE